MKKYLFLLFICTVISSQITAVEHISAFRLSSENGLPDNNIRLIEQDSTGFLRLMSVYDIYQYDGYTFRKLPREVFLQTREQQKSNGRNGKGFTHDNLGNKVLTEMGNDIVYIDKQTGEQIHITVYNDMLRQLSPSLKCNVITDKRGLIWVSVNGNGVFVYDRKTGKTDHITKDDPRRLLDADYIVSMTEDYQGNIWVSQEHYGLVCLKVMSQNYQIINISQGGSTEKENEVRLLQRLADGTIIVSSNRGLLMRADGNLEHFTVIQEKGENYNSVALDSKGQLWLGSLKRGVNVNGRWYGSNRVDCILKDSKDRMWTCCLDGDVSLVELDEHGDYIERHFLTTVKGLRPRSLFQDHQGTIWVAGDLGLFSFQPDEILKDPTKYQKVSDVPTRTFFEDANHQLWIGTTGWGLAKMNQDGSLSYINREDGLPNNVVQFIVEDARKRLCIGTEEGCANYNPQTGAVFSLYFPDHKTRNFYHADCGTLLDDGRMAFGSLDGIVVVDKNQNIKRTTYKENHLTGLYINGVSVYDMEDDSPIADELFKTKAVNLAHDQNSLTIFFSNFDYSKTHLSGYSCKLEGYDEDWSLSTNQNYAIYKKLPPGDYTFLVKYRDENGWTKEEQLLTIHISPSNWTAWWAYLIYLLLLLTVGYLIFNHLWSMEKLRRKLALEQQLTDYKLRFFTNVSHEFRTPLTLIQGAMEKIGKVNDIPSALKQPLGNMKQSTERMLRLINQLLEFRRLQNNKLSLSLVETDIIKFVYDIYIGFHDVADNRHITYTFSPFAASYLMYIDRGHVDKIVYNILSNAFKYTPERESIALTIRQSNAQVVISITDTGIGVEKDKQAELFDRYTTGRISDDSIGIGLNLSRELAHVHHGDVTYQENEPKGSIFTLTLPTDKAVYQSGDFMNMKTELQDSSPKERSGFTNSYQELKGRPLNNRRVLVVEDNYDLSSMIQDELSVYFEVDRVSNGAEALKQLKDVAQEQDAVPYDLLVSDVMMPQMNGFELVRRIRSDSQLSGIPIILLTALSGEEQIHKGLKAGADAYIEKPFSPRLLTAQAINLIEQRDRLKTVYADQPAPTAKKELMKNDTERRFLLQLDAYIENHISDYNLTVDMMAAHFEYGRTRFYNKVRQLTGKTPNDYLKEKRLTKAAELLSESESITISEVAYQVGINNAQYFSVNFKKMFGVTPSAYQKGTVINDQR